MERALKIREASRRHWKVRRSSAPDAGRPGKQAEGWRRVLVALEARRKFSAEFWSHWSVGKSSARVSGLIGQPAEVQRRVLVSSDSAPKFSALFRWAWKAGIATTVEVRKVEGSVPEPQFITFKDIGSGTTNETLTRNGVGEITGNRLKINTADLEYLHLRLVLEKREDSEHCPQRTNRCGSDTGSRGRRKQTYSGCIRQSKAHYTKALNSPEILAELARYGITKQILLLRLGREVFGTLQAFHKVHVDYPFPPII